MNMFYIAGFIGAFIGFAVYAKKQQWSNIIAAGGGLILGIFSLLITNAIFNETSKQVTQLAQVVASDRKQIDINFKSEGMSENDKAIAAKSVQAFFAACPNITRVAEDITEAKVYSGNGAAGLNNGWTRPVMMEITFSNKPKNMQVTEWRAFGHHCYYEAGGGLAPGFITSKTPCANACAATIGANGNAFVSDAAFQFLDEKTPEYFQKLEQAKLKYEKDLEKELKLAESGNIDGISNMAYLHRTGTLGYEGDQYMTCVWSIALYYKYKPDINPELVQNVNERREMGQGDIDFKRKTAERICVSNLKDAEIMRALNDAAELAQALPKKTYLERPIFVGD